MLTILMLPNGPLANKLNYISAIILTEDGAHKEIVDTIDEGHEYLCLLIKGGLANSDQATIIEAQMIEAGMCVNVKDLHARCDLTDCNPSSEYGLELSTNTPITECVPHGRITHQGNPLSEWASNFFDLFNICNVAVNNKEMSTNDAMVVVKQAIAGKMLLTPDQANKVYKQLPAEMKPRRMSLNLFHFFDNED